MFLLPHSCSRKRGLKSSGSTKRRNLRPVRNTFLRLHGIGERPPAATMHDAGQPGETCSTRDFAKLGMGGCPIRCLSNRLLEEAAPVPPSAQEHPCRSRATAIPTSRFYESHCRIIPVRYSMQYTTKCPLFCRAHVFLSRALWRYQATFANGTLYTTQRNRAFFLASQKSFET